MPYIDEKARERLKRDDSPKAHNPGDLNYLITKMLLNYIEDRGMSYKVINDVIGVLECAKMELYRRHAVPYENAKMAQNGDV